MSVKSSTISTDIFMRTALTEILPEQMFTCKLLSMRYEPRLSFHVPFVRSYKIYTFASIYIVNLRKPKCLNDGPVSTMYDRLPYEIVWVDERRNTCRESCYRLRCTRIPVINSVPKSPVAINNEFFKPLVAQIGELNRYAAPRRMVNN